MEFKNIETNINHHIFYITLHNPEQRNTLNTETLNEIKNSLYLAESDEKTRVVVFKSSNDKVFASGADINQLNQRGPFDSLISNMQEIYDEIEDCSKTTIAIVNGFALGGGCELALASDIRIATEHAKFGFPELNLGIIPGAGGTQRLAKMIGKGRAIDMILTGKIVNGEEAERIGLASYYVSLENLNEKFEELIDNISQKAPIAVSLVKSSIHQGFNLDRDSASKIEKLSQAITFASEDKNEGTKAFLEKREADFKNK